MYRFIITVILLISAAIANHSYSKPEPELERSPLSAFPRQMPGWRIVNEQKMDGESMEVLQVDDYIMRTYINEKGETMGLYVGYFNTQREGKQVHSPRQCLPGAGWNILENRVYTLEGTDQKMQGKKLNLYLMGKGTERQLYLWWYHGRGRIYASEYANKLYLIWDAMTKRRTDGALVRVNMPLISSIDQTLKTELDFVYHLFPVLSRFIPD
jgi:EpsI family protein